MDKFKQESPQGKIYSTSSNSPYQPECKTCDDLKWIRPGNQDSRDVKYEPCPDCSKFSIKSDDSVRLELAGFDGLNRPLHTFSDYMPDKQPNVDARTQCREAKNIVSRWIQKQSPYLIMLTGPTGTGKTHLCESAANELIKAGLEVWYVTGTIYGHRMRDMNGVHAFKEQLLTKDMLILDEMYVSWDNNDYLKTTLQEVIVHRSDRYMPTLIAGNIKDDEAKNPEAALANIVGQRVMSRVLSNLGEKAEGKLVSLWKSNDVRREDESNQ